MAFPKWPGSPNYFLKNDAPEPFFKGPHYQYLLYLVHLNVSSPSIFARILPICWLEFAPKNLLISLEPNVAIFNLKIVSRRKTSETTKFI